MGIFEQAIMDQVAADEQQRLRRFQAAWRAYYGQDVKPLKVKPGKPDRAAYRSDSTDIKAPRC